MLCTCSRQDKKRRCVEINTYHTRCNRHSQWMLNIKQQYSTHTWVTLLDGGRSNSTSGFCTQCADALLPSRDCRYYYSVDYYSVFFFVQRIISKQPLRSHRTIVSASDVCGSHRSQRGGQRTQTNTSTHITHHTYIPDARETTIISEGT